MGGRSNSVSRASYAVRLITKSRLPLANDHLDQRHHDSPFAMERHPPRLFAHDRRSRARVLALVRGVAFDEPSGALRTRDQWRIRGSARGLDQGVRIVAIYPVGGGAASNVLDSWRSWQTAEFCSNGRLQALKEWVTLLLAHTDGEDSQLTPAEQGHDVRTMNDSL